MAPGRSAALWMNDSGGSAESVPDFKGEEDRPPSPGYMGYPPYPDLGISAVIGTLRLSPHHKAPLPRHRNGGDGLPGFCSMGLQNIVLGISLAIHIGS